MLWIRYSIKFHLFRRKRTDGSCTIRMSITWSHHRILVYLPVSVYEDNWCPFVMMAYPTKEHPEVNQVNEIITDYSKIANDLFRKAEQNNYLPNEEEVRSAFKIPEKEYHSLLQLICEFTHQQSLERGWALATQNKFGVLLRDLTNAGLTNIEEMNAAGMRKYLDYLYGKNYENSVLMKKASILRWFLGWCRRFGYLDNDEYKLHQPHLKCPQKPVRYLTWEELMRLYYFDYGENQTLATARDIFCFCAFTSLRYSDAINLKWADVRNDHISIITQKTCDHLIIELNIFSQRILDKYYNLTVGQTTDSVFPSIPILKCNHWIKECARLANIDSPQNLISFRGGKREERCVPKWKAITTHYARRTFVVNSLRLGIPAEVIMKWTGHSDFTAMKPYVAIVDELRKENMAKYADLFEKEKNSSN